MKRKERDNEERTSLSECTSFVLDAMEKSNYKNFGVHTSDKDWDVEQMFGRICVCSLYEDELVDAIQHAETAETKYIYIIGTNDAPCWMDGSFAPANFPQIEDAPEGYTPKYCQFTSAEIIFKAENLHVKEAEGAEQ